MKKTKITLIILILLTVVSAFVSSTIGVYTALILLVLTAFKFIGISLVFMGLREAHPFWKGSILVFLLIFLGIVLMILQ